MGAQELDFMLENCEYEQKSPIDQEVTKHALECKLERAGSGTIAPETGMGTGVEKRAGKNRLLDDLSYNTRSNCSSAFSDSESQSFFDRDRSDQGNCHCDVVSRHAHFSSFR